MRLSEVIESVLQLVFPHICDGCGTDILPSGSNLCMKCIASLPATCFERLPGNPVEKKFYGRIELEHAMAGFYFTKGSLIQRLVHQVKYRQNKELGLQLGRLMGAQLKESRWRSIDGLIPLPLFPRKERQRGYNQATLLCEGIAEQLELPVMNGIANRPQHTETQTKKGRIERWKNMEGKFVIANPGLIKGKHLMLVDDIITTGATLESCGAELINAAQVRLSIACLGYSFQ